MNKICFSYQGKQYEMTDEQIEAAYYYRQRQNLEEDAKSQIDDFIYGVDPENLSYIDRQFQEAVFLERYHMNAADVYTKIDAIILRYQIGFDCNIDENSAWRNAIQSVLTGN